MFTSQKEPADCTGQELRARQEGEEGPERGDEVQEELQGLAPAAARRRF